MERVDVAILGAGPAGLAAALAADGAGASVLLIEREERCGGVLKQCIHDGFGVERFGKKLSGCEYMTVFLRKLKDSGVRTALSAFCTSIEKREAGFHLTLSSPSGMREVMARALVLATGCRERTAKQVQVHGTRPAGVLTAGSAQYAVNILGQLPGKRIVILGSGDIGLIMARRLTLEGATVLGVYEAKPTPGGLARNISQCLADYAIPLHLSTTVTRVFGDARVTGVETAKVDAQMNRIPGTEERIACDTLIVSVGLIPENELAESLGVPLDARTHGPICDQNDQTLTDGVFCCGNALQVSDLVDRVSENGEDAGRAAAAYVKGHAPRRLIALSADTPFLYAVPQRIDIDNVEDSFALYFRVTDEHGPSTVHLMLDGREIQKRPYRALRPPEMERMTVRLCRDALCPDSRLTLTLTED